jgi:hypothetical protein
MNENERRKTKRNSKVEPSRISVMRAFLPLPEKEKEKD